MASAEFRISFCSFLLLVSRTRICLPVSLAITNVDLVRVMIDTWWLADDCVTLVADSPKITLAPRNQRVVDGGKASFFCKASGNPAPDVYWRKAGRRITTGRQRYVERRVLAQFLNQLFDAIIRAIFSGNFSAVFKFCRMIVKRMWPFCSTVLP